MRIRYRIMIGAALITGGVILFKALIGKSVVSLFMPQGVIAAAQRHLIITEALIMLALAAVTLGFLYFTAWKYREGNEKARRDEEHGGSLFAQLALLAIPVTLVIILGTINWKSAFALSPYKPIPSQAKPLTIQVVALPWKWLFIYPAQNIATVNFIQFPEKTPLHFELAADAPMSSFWIPQLGSQIYAMDGMVTQLNLEASTTGEFSGKDTEINGAGYAGMTFTAKSSSESDFNAWVSSVKRSSSTLTFGEYNVLRKPSEYVPPAYYSSVEGGLYNYIVMKFMTPNASGTEFGTGPSALQLIPAFQNTQPGQ